MLRSVILAVIAVFLFLPRTSAQNTFIIEQELSAPLPANLTASKSGARVAWTLDQEGRRNIWVTEGPEFQARQLTAYDIDDGQALSDVHFSVDGDFVIYVRGEGKNPAGQSPNPTSNPAGVEQSVWSIGWSSREAKKVDAGQASEISAQGAIAYIKDNQLWLGRLDAAEKS